MVRGLARSGMRNYFAQGALLSQASTSVDVWQRVLASSIVSHVHTGLGHGPRSLSPQLLGCQQLADWDFRGYSPLPCDVQESIRKFLRLDRKVARCFDTVAAG